MQYRYRRGEALPSRRGAIATTQKGSAVWDPRVLWQRRDLDARQADCHVTGLTLSTEQLTFARRAATEAGLEQQLDFQLRDYRDVDERFDHVVSIEMYEAVGERYWPDYFGAIFRALKPGGRAAIQAITGDDRYRPSLWLRRRGLLDLPMATPDSGPAAG